MSIITTALEIISLARLSPTEHLLLTDFVKEAVEPALAATHLVSRIERDSPEDVVLSLRQFKEDWRKLAGRMSIYHPIPQRLNSLVQLRDGPRCSLTKNSANDPVSKAEPVYVVPPSMLDDIEVAEQGRLITMLDAYLTPSHVSRLRAAIDKPSLENVWLLSPSMHRAFREGHVAVKLGYKSPGQAESKADLTEEIPSLSDWHLLESLTPGDIAGISLGDGTEFRHLVRFRFSTPDPKTLPVPRIFLFEVHRQFAKALHLFSIEDEVARGWPKPPGDLFGLDFPVLRQAFYCTWLYLPSWIRVRSYILLAKVGRHLYGRGLQPSVQRLPFGLILKQCIRAPQNEPNALKLVENHTSIPGPRVVDMGEHDDTVHLLMTHLPGQMLNKVCHLMSYEERDRFADDLRSYVTQLRKIPNHTPFMFCNTLGGPIIARRRWRTISI